MMKQILITNKYVGLPRRIIEGIIDDNFEAVFLENNTKECLIDSVENADYILASGRLIIDQCVLEKSKCLKMIQRTGSGLDSINLDDLRNRQIPLYVNHGLNSESVAEYTLLLMLGCLRRLPVIDKNTKNGIWKKQEQGVETKELYGKTVGLIGFGSIGRKVANMLQPFCTNTLYYSRNRADEETENRLNVKYSNFSELLACSDIISIHCPLTPETVHMIDEDAFKIMKNGVIIINTSRGGVLDPNALALALGDQRVAFAGIDVYENEPITIDNPLKNLENIILSPHIAGVTKESFERMMMSAISNIRMFDEGKLEEIEDYRVV